MSILCKPTVSYKVATCHIAGVSKSNYPCSEILNF